MKNVNIIEILDPGIANSERLQLRALSQDNIGRYLILNTHEVSPGRVSSTIKDVYWFPDSAIKQGDLIFLHTGPGTDTTTQNVDGTTNHFFYWGKNLTLWNGAGDSVVLLESGSWEFKTRT